MKYGLERSNDMKIVIFGGTGLLGKEMQRRWMTDDVMALSSGEGDISDLHQVRSLLEEFHPEAVVNCAAIVNPEICEKNPELAFRVNAIGARNIAICCEEMGCKNVYLSTDHLFDGRKGAAYTEFDAVAPINEYGRSKREGENFTKHLCRQYFIVRTSILFGIHRETLVSRTIREAREGKLIEVPKDQVVSPTYTKDLSLWIRELLEDKEYGIHHMTNAGFCNRYELVLEVLRCAGYPAAKVVPFSSDFSGKAQRPLDVVLDPFIHRLGGKEPFRGWKEALVEFIQNEQ